MDNDYSSGLENPLYSELKYFCRKIQEAYNELKEDLTPYRDDRFYRWLSCLPTNTMAHPFSAALYNRAIWALYAVNYDHQTNVPCCAEQLCVIMGMLC